MNPLFKSSRLSIKLVVLIFSIFVFSNGLFAQIQTNIQSNNIANKSQDFVANEIIVQFKSSASGLVATAARQKKSRIGLTEIDNLNRKYGVSEIKQAFQFRSTTNARQQLADKFGLTRTFILTVPNNTNIETLLKEYNASNEVEYAEPNNLMQAHNIPTDPLYTQQWGLNNTGQAVSHTGPLVGTPGADINAELAWDLHTGSNSITVAILDSGVDYNHPEFAGRMVSGYDFINDDADPMDDNGHGTACAGIAAASGNNGIGVAGINWNCLIMPVKVLGSGGSGSTIGVANGIIWAADNGADVLSLSLGGGGASITEENAVNYAHSLGSIIVASRGNNNNANASYPASFENVIAIGALSPCNERTSPSSCDGETWWGSSYGADLDVMAPGTRINTTGVGGGYIPTFNGTSAAAPFVAGVAALIRSYAPTLTNDEIRDIIQTTAVDIGAPGFDNETGYGRVNAYAALVFAGNAVPPEVSVSPANLSFTLDPDQTDNDTFAINNIGGTDALSLFWGIVENPSCSWLSVDNSSGKIVNGANELITVNINTTGLINGNYQCTLQVNSNDSNNPIKEVIVDLTVNYLPPPEVNITPAALTYSVDIGETITDELTIANDAAPGNLNLHWSASIQGSLPGISLNLTSGTAAPGTNNKVQLNINAAGVSDGIYTGSIDFTTNDPSNQLVSVPVELTVVYTEVGGEKLYVFNGSNPASIIRADLDGQKASQPFVGLGRPIDGAVDVVNRKLYFMDWSPDIGIYRADLNGTNKEKLYTTTGAVVSIALDVANNHMYFAQQIAGTTYRISRANLDGSNVISLADIPSWGISGMTIVPSQGKIYWGNRYDTNHAAGTGVWRANLDLTGQEKLTSGGSTTRGLSLDVTNYEMYWYEIRNLGGGNFLRVIRKATMDGLNGEDILNVEAGDIAIDPVGGKIYWTQQNGGFGNITYDTYRANLDGTNTEALGLWGYRLAIDPTPATIPDVADLPDINEPCESTPTAPTANNGALTATSDTTFPIITQGTTVVIWTYNDGNGNTVTQTQNVMINDNVAPTALCENITVQLDANGNASITAAQINNNSTDNCGIASISVSPSTFDCDDVVASGTQVWINEIHYDNVGADTGEFLEIAGTAGTDLSAYQLLAYDADNLLDDTKTLSGVIPDEGNGFGVIVFTASDLSSQYFENGPKEGRVLLKTGTGGDPDIVVQFISYEGVVNAADGPANGLTSTDIGFSEVSSTPIGLSLQLEGAGGQASDFAWAAPQAESPGVLNTNQSVGNGVAVVLTVTDVNGNKDTCTAFVTVQDNIPPTALCKTGVVAYLDANGNASITAAQINNNSTDNCEIASISVSPNTFNCNQEGQDVTVTLTVTDVNGNVSTCDTTVEVDDKILPDAVCKDIVIQLDANGNASIVPSDVDGGSTDNCGWTRALSVTPNTFNCTNIGANTVTLKVGDGNGNQNTCTATVTVQDNVAPTALCQDVTVQLDANGNGSTTAEAVDNGSKDNCGIKSVSLNKTDFTCANIGANTVTLTVTDVDGNTSTCTATVTVQDNIKPIITCPADITIECDEGTSPANTGMATATDNCDANPVISSQDIVSGNVAGYFSENQEVPASGSPGSGTVTGSFNTATNELTLNISYNGLVGNSFAAHIHNGPAGTNGPVIVPLSIIPGNQSGSFAETVNIPPANVAALLAGDTYINIHTDETPSGEIRAQLSAVDCGSFIIRTWTATDVSGNSATCNQIIKIIDTTAPDAPNPPASVDVQCATDVPPPVDLTASDNCDSDITVSPVEIINGNVSGNLSGNQEVPASGSPGTGMVTGSFNTVTNELTLNISYNGLVGNSIAAHVHSAPAGANGGVIVPLTIPGGQSGFFTETVNIPPADVAALLAGNTYVNIHTDETPSGEIRAQLDVVDLGDCENKFSIVRTWTFTDKCGNQSSVSQTIIVNDDTPPDAPNPPVDVNVQCAADVPPLVDLTATDNCDSDITVSPSIETTPGNCENQFTEVRTWTFIDTCGNTSSVSQTINVNDDTPPTIDCLTNSIELPGCNPTRPKVDDAISTIVVNDNCGIKSVIATAGNVSGDCHKTQTFNVVVTDLCGNAANCDVTYTWFEDFEAPIVTAQHERTFDLGCNPTEADFPTPQSLIDKGFITVTDDCNATLPIIVLDRTELIHIGCKNFLLYYYKATDDCGNVTPLEKMAKVTYQWEEDDVPTCDVAFARYKGAEMCFADDTDSNSNQTGWTNYFDTPGEYTMQLYAGVSNCDVLNSENVGKVVVDYTGDYITLNYVLYENYVMGEAYVNIGCDKYPLDNSGQSTTDSDHFNYRMPELGYVTNYTVGPIDVSKTSGVYVIAEAVTCLQKCDCSVSPHEGGVYPLTSDNDNVQCKAPDVTLSNNDNVNSPTFKAYPVPFKNDVFLEYKFNYETDVTIEVFDLKGALMKRVINKDYIPGATSKTKMDFSKFSDQLYFVKLTTRKGTGVKKIVSN